MVEIKEGGTVNNFAMQDRHCPVGSYFARFRPNYDDRCRHCGESEETVDHVLNECPQLNELRGRMSVTSDLYGTV